MALNGHVKSRLRVIKKKKEKKKSLTALRQNIVFQANHTRSFIARRYQIRWNFIPKIDNGSVVN